MLISIAFFALFVACEDRPWLVLRRICSVFCLFSVFCLNAEILPLTSHLFNRVVEVWAGAVEVASDAGSGDLGCDACSLAEIIAHIIAIDKSVTYKDSDSGSPPKVQQP